MASEFDAVLADWEKDEGRDLRASATAHADLDAATYAKASKLSQELGLPFGAVADNLAEFEQQAFGRQLDGLVRDTPVTARFLRDGRRLAIARDDLEPLQRIERTLKRGDTIGPTPDPSFLDEVISSAHAGWIRGKNFVSTFVLDPLLPNPVSDETARGLGYRSAADMEAFQTATRYADRNREAQRVERRSAATAAELQDIASADGWVDSAGAVLTSPRALSTTIAQSLGQGAPGLAVTAAASGAGPVGTATAAGGTSFALEYGNAVATAMQRAGVDDTDADSVYRFLRDPKRMAEARAYATKRGVPVAIFDAVTAGVAGRLWAGVKPTLTSGTARVAGETAIQAGGGAAGELSAQVASGDPINPADVITEAVAELPSAAVEVPGNVAHLRTLREESGRVMASGMEAERLAEFTAAASESKLGERSPADLQAHVAELGDNTVFIDAKIARELFQSAKLDPIQTADQVTGQENALAVADAAGGDLAIPAARWASLIARLPNAAEFARHGRMNPDHLSAAELDTFDPGSIAQANLEPAPAEPDVAGIESDVLAQLSATGLYTGSDAQRQAQLYGAVFRTLGKRTGESPQALYDALQLRIARAKPFDTLGPATVRRQGQGDEARGRLLVFGDKTLQIDLFRTADASTFIHESAHAFWEVFADLATKDGAAPDIARDYQATLEWLGVASPEALTDEHFERWARAFERYLGEGVAPTPELQSVFSRIRAWIVDVYRDLTRLGVELSPEIRGVFDRLLATDEEIDAAKTRQGMTPLDLAREAEALGLTESGWRDYIDQVERAGIAARESAAQQQAASQSAELQEWREEARSVIRAEIEGEIAADPATRALRILRGDTEIEGEPLPANLREVKIDPATLPASIASALQPLGVTAADGIAPDTVANLLGFPSGDALVQALFALHARQGRIEAEVDARMQQRHPATAALSETALQAVHTDAQLDVLDREIGLLAKLADRPKPDRRQLRAAAAHVIGKQRIRDLRPGAYLSAERRAAKRAQRHAARKEYAAALTAKRQQLFNAALYSEARLALATVEQQQNFAASLQRPTARARFGKAGLLGPLDQVLELYSFRPVSDRQRERAATLRGWYDRMLEQGIDPQVPAEVMRQIDEARQTHYRDLTIEQLAEVVDLLKLLDHQAKEAFELRLAGERMELDAAAAELAEKLRAAFRSRRPPPVSESQRRKLGEVSKRVGRMAWTLLLRLRTLAHWVDGEGHVEGTFHRFIVRPLDRAQADYLDRMKQYGDAVVDLFKSHLSQVDTAAPLWVATINQTLTKGDVIAVALNTGNPSNLQRLQDGRGWGDPQMMEILGHMTKADWDFVQAVWDTLETLWPEIAAQQKRLTGLEPPKVETRQVHTAFGTYRGGYFPLVYDRTSAQWRQLVHAETDSFFDPLALSALPPHGHTAERVRKANLPVKLDLAVIPSHLSSVLKDLTHRETVIGIRKLSKAPDVVQAMTQTLGGEYLDLIEDKLREVATDQLVQQGRTFAPLRGFSQGVRRHVGIMAQGFNVVSGIKQIVGIANAVEVMIARHGRTGIPLLLQAYQRVFRRGTVESVQALSGEMRHRLNTADVDTRQAMNRYLSGRMAQDVKGRARQFHDGAIAHAYIFIKYAQTYGVDLPLWLAAHEGALRNGLQGDAATAYADDAVIASQGAGGAKDTALIEGNVPFLEWLTMFYSYGSAYVNRQASIVRDVAASRDQGRLMAEMPLLSARLLFLVALPVIVDDLISQAAGSSDGPGDDEGWASYYGARMFAYLFYGIPGLRDLAGAKFGYRLSPAQSIGDAYNRLAGDVAKAAGGDAPEARQAARDAVHVAGYSLGLPLAGPWRHVDYLWRVFDGQEEPQSVPEFAAAAVLAKREQR